MDLLEWMNQEGAVLKKAPLTFATLLAIGLSAGFAAASYLDRREVAAAVAERDFFKDRLEGADHSRPSITPHGVIDQRTQAYLTRTIPTTIKKIIVSAVAGDQKGAAIAEAIATFLKGRGFDAHFDGGTTFVGLPDPGGVKTTLNQNGEAYVWVGPDH